MKRARFPLLRSKTARFFASVGIWAHHFSHEPHFTHGNVPKYRHPPRDSNGAILSYSGGVRTPEMMLIHLGGGWASLEARCFGF